MKNIRNIRNDETVGICGELPDPAPITEQESDRIKAKTLGLITPRRSKPRRFVSIAAAVICMFTLIACSAEVFQWYYRLSAVLNLNDNEKAYAEKKKMTTNVSDAPFSECDGVKISLRQVVADGRLCYLIFDAELPEKHVYLAEGAPIFENFKIQGLSYCANPRTLTLPQDASAESNKVSMYVVGFFEDDAPNNNIPVTVAMSSLTYRTYSRVETIEGIWNISFKVDKNREHLEGKTDIQYEVPTQDGATETGRITGYSLSPLSLTLEYIPDRPDGESSSFVEPHPISLRLKNGEDIPVEFIDAELNRITGHYDKSIGKDVWLHEIVINRMIDIDQVSEIVFNGSVIPVTK